MFNRGSKSLTHRIGVPPITGIIFGLFLNFPTRSFAQYGGGLNPSPHSKDFTRGIVALPGQIEYEEGLNHYFGRGSHSKNHQVARDRFRDSAKRNYAPGLRAYGMMLANGEGGDKDEKQAAEWMKRAALRGDAGGQYEYGRYCHSGTGVEKSETDAAFWWRKAAEQGNPEAQNSLAVLLLRGEGIPRDDAEGMKWLIRSAEGGLGRSQLYLGQIFMNSDKKAAYYWLRRAVDEHEPEAAKLLEQLKLQLPPETIAAVEAELKTSPVTAPEPVNK